MRLTLIAMLAGLASPAAAQMPTYGSQNNDLFGGSRNSQFGQQDTFGSGPNMNRSTGVPENRSYYSQEPTLGDSRPYRRTNPRSCTSLLCD